MSTRVKEKGIPSLLLEYGTVKLGEKMRQSWAGRMALKVGSVVLWPFWLMWLISSLPFKLAWRVVKWSWNQATKLPAKVYDLALWMLEWVIGYKWRLLTLTGLSLMATVAVAASLAIPATMILAYVLALSALILAVVWMWGTIKDLLIATFLVVVYLTTHGAEVMIVSLPVLALVLYGRSWVGLGLAVVLMAFWLWLVWVNWPRWLHLEELVEARALGKSLWVEPKAQEKNLRKIMENRREDYSWREKMIWWGIKFSLWILPIVTLAGSIWLGSLWGTVIVGLVAYLWTLFIWGRGYALNPIDFGQIMVVKTDKEGEYWDFKFDIIELPLSRWEAVPSLLGLAGELLLFLAIVLGLDWWLLASWPTWWLETMVVSVSVLVIGGGYLLYDYRNRVPAVESLWREVRVNTVDENLEDDLSFMGVGSFKPTYMKGITSWRIADPRNTFTDFWYELIGYKPTYIDFLGEHAARIPIAYRGMRWPQDLGSPEVTMQEGERALRAFVSYMVARYRQKR